MSSPPNRNSYLAYKRDNAQIIRWIVTTASNITRKRNQQQHPHPPLSAPAPETSKKSGNDNGKGQSPKINSPEITVASLVSLSELISTSTMSIPATVYRLFKSVIRARTSAYEFWDSIYASDQNEDVNRSNEAHKAFINALKTAYEVLGGLQWEQQAKEQKLPPGEDDELLANRFLGLEIDELSSDGDTSEGSEKPQNVTPQQQQARRKNRKGKGKGKKRFAAASAQKPQDWSLEDFRLKDDPGSETEAVFAAFCFLHDMLNLRRYTSNLWRQVAEEQLHITIAGALCNAAVARVKQLQYDAAADFPQLSNFEAIVNSLFRGDVGAVGGRIKAVTTDSLGNTENFALDFREYFSVHAHDDLASFITDYRKNRNGKPSPAYASLKWDPDINLSELSAKERLEWRSQYSMIWLYDIVNSYASTVLTKNTPGKILDAWDWGMENMGRKTRRMLWGPVEFAGEVTALAMKRTDSPIAKLIKPHLIFQVQMMLDSMTAFKGWNVDVMVGDCIGPERPWGIAYTDIVSFHENFTSGANALIREYQADQVRYGEARRHEFPLEEIPKTLTEVQLVLGDSMLSRAKGAPSSRFEYIDRNGMWIYNPWLCGTGLTEAVNFVFEFGITAWDKSGAALCIFHLYNMLLVTGHLPKGKISIMEDLLSVFETEVFRGGKRPTQDFYGAWMVAAGVKAQVLADPRKKRMTKGGNILDSGERMASIYRRAEVRCFHKKSILRNLQGVDWIPEKLPKENIPSRKQAGNSLIRAVKRSGTVSAQGLRIVPNQQQVPTDDGLLFTLQCALIEEVSGEAPFAALNLLSLMAYIMRVFENLDEGTKDFPRPLGHPVGPRTTHNCVIKLALDLDAMGERLQGNEVLAEMGRIFEKYVGGVELSEFTFWDWVVGEGSECDKCGCDKCGRSY